MSHHFTFSIIGAHIKNAENEINLMKEIKQYTKSDLNYGARENEIFEWNIQHGILAIYSLNAALESIIALLNNRLNINIDSHVNGAFYKRVKQLEKMKIVTDKISFSKCEELRDYRNTITHWEENKSQLLGSMNYLIFMFHNMKPKNENEKLIYILNKKDLSQYLNSFNDLIDNIMSSKYIKQDSELERFFEFIRDGVLSFEVLL